VQTSAAGAGGSVQRGRVRVARACGACVWRVRVARRVWRGACGGGGKDRTSRTRPSSNRSSVDACSIDVVPGDRIVRLFDDDHAHMAERRVPGLLDAVGEGVERAGFDDRLSDRILVLGRYLHQN